VAGGTVGGGTFPCLISNYNNIEPSYYTFDLSIGYDTGDDPANTLSEASRYQLVCSEHNGSASPRSNTASARGGNPAAFDISKSDQGRTIGLILTKTW